VAVLDAMDEFSAVKQSGTDAHKINAGQTTFTTGVDSLEITALIPGADYNNLAISVVTQNGLGAAGATATYDATANTLVIAIDDTEVTDLQTIDNAIDGLKEFASAKSAKGTDRVTGSGADANATANTEATGGNLLLDELVVEIGGSEGSEVFFFEKDASVNQVVQAISLVSDATGVTASQSHGLLSLISSRYGAAGFVEINVISEGGSGQFKDNVGATRQSGTDIAATVNGITANGDGNVLSINTAALDMSITVTAGSSTNFEFNITGGGALFQLGPDVVSNQQARLGIQSVNTTKLRGQNGRLYQLGSGESAALDTNPTLAAKIVDQVINKVTSLRGRLGAFQKTTLDTNINSLNDTLENLTDAESTIRDADFAAESAALTRSQILVQSGVSVLAIANTNPQNVLALLR
jgi:flagellin